MPIKILTFSTLYPDSSRPTHGIFVENRLRQLLSGSKTEARVLAPVPWFPTAGKRFGNYGSFAKVPRREVRHGIDIAHPRYPLVPKIGMTLAPWLMAVAVRSRFQKIVEDGYDFDLIDAHYFYPDGVAAAILARTIGKPLVITARGTDINLIPKYFFARQMIRWAATSAAAVIAVSTSLKETLAALGISRDKITVLRNGVDLSQFKPPQNREELRKKLGLVGKTLLSVGNLVPLKRQDNIIGALRSLPDTTLMIAGAGPERKKLELMAEQQKVSHRVRFLGTIEHERLQEFYGAADAFVLASSREGWPNVLLESLACGTPVICTKVGCTPELIAAPEAGLLLEDSAPETIARTFEELLLRRSNRDATRRYAEQYGWGETTLGQMRVFEKVLTGSAGGTAARA